MKPAAIARIGAGIVLAILGIVLVFIPLAVADVLGRPSGTSGELINLRATWGGSVLGLGAFLCVRDALKPWKTTILWFLLCTMAAIGAARTVGFVLDGHPDGLQWFWLLAEIAISAVCAALLFRKKTRI